MKDTTIIHLTNITKTYKLYNKHTDRVKEAFNPFNKKYHTSFNALTNISLDIHKGETIGIIGKNGSGKSTLLQIICGILTPSSGSVSIKGRVSALLELGTGFNPEFTGRENVYLNASILGLKKAEIDACFDQIADFADIDIFIDQPVKSYSSGMYVRLAFAVAINVNPDILIVDEALAVGDTMFQVKCFEKFREFQNNGVTILFVTHSLDLITRHCDRAFLLNSGTLHDEGNPKDIVDEYNRLLVESSIIEGKKSHIKDDTRTEEVTEKPSNQKWRGFFTVNPNENRYGSGQARIIEAGIFNHRDEAVQKLLTGDSYTFKMRVVFIKTTKDPIFAYTIKDLKGFDISGTNTRFQEINTGTYHQGDTVEIIFTHSMILNSGTYLLSFGCAGIESSEHVIYDRRYDYMTFEVISNRAIVGFVDLKSNIELIRT
ncbi:MAG: ABC transporter ATP-binding protein [Bacteroidetes bacterium]|nr:ABC transporter ATP-binding protein [Bacteroidota bacterium]